MIWVDRLEEEAEAQPMTAELIQQLDAAVEQYEQALEMMAADALGDIATLHNQLARALQFDPSRHENALEHFRRSCQYAIAVGRYYEAATARGNFAQLLAMMERPDEAAVAAEQALAEFRAISLIDGGMITVLERIKRCGS
jgi:tetratricopeptide (TPR) repeat protein